MRFFKTLDGYIQFYQSMAFSAFPILYDILCNGRTEELLGTAKA